MVTNLPKDGHLPSEIKIYQNEVYYILEIWDLDLIQKIKTKSQLPWMVSHYPQDGHSSSKIYLKDLYYKHGIWHLDLTHKIKTR